MNIDRLVIAMAGSIIVTSLVLSQIFNPNWLWVTAFVGTNLLQSSVTGFCPVVKVLKSIGLRPGVAFK